MSHQRYPSIDPIKEPHSVSLKVLRLSRPSLVTQQPLPAPFSSSSTNDHDTAPMPASIAYSSNATEKNNNENATNPAPFLLAPILNLPPSFGSAYVGETFSCTLCANHDIPPDPPFPALASPVVVPVAGSSGAAQLSAPPLASSQQQKKKFIRDVRIEAEMKTPGPGGAVQKLVLGPSSSSAGAGGGGGGVGGTDLEPGRTLQRIVSFDLKEEGNHVLAVTVSYYEATETSGRTRTFRKLYQFICKGSLIVRTKVSPMPSSFSSSGGGFEVEGKKNEKEGELGAGVGGRRGRGRRKGGGRSWAMEAQLENCSEDVMQLERVGLDLEPGLRYADCNYWGVGVGVGVGSGGGGGGMAVNKPVLHPGEVEQCCFVVEEESEDTVAVLEDGSGGGKIVFGVLGISWRSEMGNKGFLSTGKLGTRVAAAAAAAVR